MSANAPAIISPATYFAYVQQMIQKVSTLSAELEAIANDINEMLPTVNIDALVAKQLEAEEKSKELNDAVLVLQRLNDIMGNVLKSSN